MVMDNGGDIDNTDKVGTHVCVRGVLRNRVKMFFFFLQITRAHIQPEIGEGCRMPRLVCCALPA